MTTNTAPEFIALITFPLLCLNLSIFLNQQKYYYCYCHIIIIEGVHGKMPYK